MRAIFVACLILAVGANAMKLVSYESCGSNTVVVTDAKLYEVEEKLAVSINVGNVRAACGKLKYTVFLGSFPYMDNAIPSPVGCPLPQGDTQFALPFDGVNEAPRAKYTVKVHMDEVGFCYTFQFVQP